MPTYEYKCTNCNRRFVVVESISQHESKRPACPKCKSKKITRLLGSFFAKTSKKS